MRILKLHFKNLNSLLGEWKIDFTAPEYSEQGIFAITGPTGAGKSTILDAISLSLYGKTPRLGKITASNNDIMSRQRGECFASVEFLTSNGHYRTLWEQSRARKNPNGNLQQAQHSIEDVRNRRELESSLRNTENKVIEVTGMDFEHFTRAMLLAQGSFAKFLQSSADDRSPILEKITGTEIYTQISKLVHEKKISEDYQLSTLNNQLEGIRLLEPEEIALIKNEKQLLEVKAREYTSNKSELEKQHSWIIGLEKLHGELVNINNAQEKLQLEKDEFANDEIRLKTAKIVDEINSDVYINLISLREQVKSINHNLDANLSNLPQLDLAMKNQQDDVVKINTELTHYKLQLEDNLKAAQNARLLDADILNNQSRLSDLQNNLNTSSSELNKLQLQHKEFNIVLQEKQQQSVKITSYLTEFQKDATLVTNYSGICSSIDRLDSLHLQIKQLQTQKISEQSIQQELSQQLASIKQDEDKYIAEHATIAKRIDNLQQHIQQIANGKISSTLNEDIVNLTSKQSDYRDMAKNLQDRFILAQQQNELQAEMNEQQKQLENLQPKLNRESELLGFTSQLIDSLNKQKLLQSKISSLTEERNKLEPQQPCPLCGALEHPFATDLPINNELDTQIINAKERIDKLQELVTRYTADIATNRANIAKLKQQYEDICNREANLSKQINFQLAKYDLVVDINNIDAFNTDLHKIEEQIRQLQQQIKLLNEYETRLIEDKNKQQQFETKLNTLKINITELTVKDAASKNKLSEIAHRILMIQNEFDSLSAELISSLNDYQITDLNINEISSIKEMLGNRLSNWQSNQQEAEKIKQQLQELNYQISQNLSLQDNISAQINGQQTEIEINEFKLREIKAARFAIFGDKNIDETEKQWQQELHQLEQKSKESEIKLNQVKERITTLTTVIKNDQDRLQPLESNLLQQENLFINHLNAANIANEEDFIAKRLSREEISRIQNRQENIIKQTIELDTRLKQTQERLSLEEAKQLTTKTIAEIQMEVESKQTDYENYNQRIGQLNGQLLANETSQNQKGEIIKQRDKQQIQAERFRQLHSLIGSSDGKKFRNFAQGLTFEMVVALANRQLTQMSDRYLLIRDQAAPLELNVVDNYQGGEIRTTKNLSGGESFVISLALALGLSRLSSNKVQVDSLFLDEGFGTLDEESLQTALDALDSLQRDGKLIGVISHVAALKDRIPLQIQVEPLSGGVSRIKGIGCKQGYTN